MLRCFPNGAQTVHKWQNLASELQVDAIWGTVMYSDHWILYSRVYSHSIHSGLFHLVSCENSERQTQLLNQNQSKSKCQKCQRKMLSYFCIFCCSPLWSASLAPKQHTVKRHSSLVLEHDQKISKVSPEIVGPAPMAAIPAISGDTAWESVKPWNPSWLVVGFNSCSTLATSCHWDAPGIIMPRVLLAQHR